MSRASYSACLLCLLQRAALCLSRTLCCLTIPPHATCFVTAATFPTYEHTSCCSQTIVVGVTTFCAWRGVSTVLLLRPCMKLGSRQNRKSVFPPLTRTLKPSAECKQKQGLLHVSSVAILDPSTDCFGTFFAPPSCGCEIHSVRTPKKYMIIRFV